MNEPLKRSRFASLFTLMGVLAVTGVAGGCTATPTHDSAGLFVEDSVITTKVKSALLGDDAVKSLGIRVETFKGVVQLNGFADNADQKSAAVRDAMGVSGVKDVKDSLTLK